MINFKHTLCSLLLLLTFTGGIIAQNNTNSPYTRYGFGDLSDQGFGNSKAMGGIGFGLRDKMQINPLNPASYSAVDSLTFLLEGGVSLQSMNVNDAGVKLNAKNSSFDYLAMQFRLHPRLGVSLGLLPFSSVGYTVSDSYTVSEEGVDNNVTFGRTYTGDGGLHQVYGGFGFKVLKNLSVGMNASFLWGDITRSVTQVSDQSGANSYIRQMSLSVTSYKLDFGLQYTQALGKKHSVTVGAVYSPKHSIGNDFSSAVQASTTTTTPFDATLELPNSFGAGFTYNYNQRLTVGADYSLQQWADVSSSIAPRSGEDANATEDFRSTYEYCDLQKVSVGAEYLPNRIGRNYLSRVKYRVGAYYSTPYYKIDGKRATREWGVSAGFGLPVPRSLSILNISGQFVRTKGLETGFISENIFRLNIGITFNEGWFFKRRVQ